MDYIKEMHSYCAAQESIFDKIRKSKMTSAEYKGIKTFSNVKEFVAEALQSDKKLKGTIRGLRIGLQIDRDVPVSEIEAICTNGLANMQKIHKAICMKIVNEFNDGTDKPWNWQKKVPNGKSLLPILRMKFKQRVASFLSTVTTLVWIVPLPMALTIYMVGIALWYMAKFLPMSLMLRVNGSVIPKPSTSALKDKISSLV